MFVCLFVFRLGYFVYFLCFEPSEAFRLDFFFFFVRESIWSILLFALFHSIFFAFPPKALSWGFPSFVLEEAFWLC